MTSFILLPHSDWPWGFWTIIQEPDVSQTCCFCKKLKDLWNFPVKAKKHIYLRWLEFCWNLKNLILWGLFVPLEPIWTFIQKPGSVTFLTLGCLTSWKKSEKNWTCIPDRWKNEQKQIYRTTQLGWVSNYFVYHVDITDFQLQYGGTVLWANLEQK